LIPKPQASRNLGEKLNRTLRLSNDKERERTKTYEKGKVADIWGAAGRIDFRGCPWRYWARWSGGEKDQILKESTVST